jgi:hypothetical protein
MPVHDRFLSGSIFYPEDTYSVVLQLYVVVFGIISNGVTNRAVLRGGFRSHQSFLLSGLTKHTPRSAQTQSPSRKSRKQPGQKNGTVIYCVIARNRIPSFNERRISYR